MQHKHCYVFADEQKAARFSVAAQARGYKNAWVGNVVLANDRVYADIDKHFYIGPDERPIWMSDHE
jgi:hypothetical protein